MLYFYAKKGITRIKTRDFMLGLCTKIVGVFFYNSPLQTPFITYSLLAEKNIYYIFNKK